MRDATDQRSSTMIPIGALQQASEPHVSHAVSGPCIKSANPQSGMTNVTGCHSVWVPVRVKKTRQNKNLEIRF